MRFPRPFVPVAVAAAAALVFLASPACRKDAPPPSGKEESVRTAPRQDTNPRYDAAAFDEIARTVFRPIYPSLASQMKSSYNLTGGVAVDAGCGPGYWALELAKATELKVYALDIDPAAAAIAGRNIKAAGLEGRVEAVVGDVQAMPFADGLADLVVSRGSYLFWPDKVQAFREIWRILKPGGVAFIGGGLGSDLPLEDRTRIQEVMAERKIGPPQELEMTFEEMGAVLRSAGIPDFKVSHDAGCLCGLWVEFRKPKG
jgi:SAM-dependent methyltransferase